MTAPIVFGLVGGGWRAEFYFRIAQALPEQFRIAGCAARTEATRARIERAWNIPVFDKIDALLDQHLDFVVTSVPRATSSPLLVELTSRDVPVLAETPPGPDLEALIQLRKELPANARVQVAEQYPYQPLHAARLAFARSGKLGEIRQVQVKTASGTTTTNYPIAPLTSNPGSAINPAVGANMAQGGLDPAKSRTTRAGRPIAVTDSGSVIAGLIG